MRLMRNGRYSACRLAAPDQTRQLTEVCGGSVVSEFDPSVSIVTKPLTRNEINRMIRVLRTARDQAFGADA